MDLSETIAEFLKRDPARFLPTAVRVVSQLANRLSQAMVDKIAPQTEQDPAVAKVTAPLQNMVEDLFDSLVGPLIGQARPDGSPARRETGIDPARHGSCGRSPASWPTLATPGARSGTVTALTTPAK